MKKISLFLFLLTGPLAAGPYPPAANQEGTSAIALDDPRIMRWATNLENYSPGEDVDEIWQDTSHAISPASANPTLITSLGRGGEIVLEFVPPIKNGPGPDFAVFENSFAHTFLELSFVEVSGDGVSYERFPNSSATTNAVGSFGLLDATNIDGLAGKYIGGFGTPFDLSDLPTSPSEIRFIRLVDIIGGISRDSDDGVIYDPFPTQGSAGFDLSGIAVLEASPIVLSTEISEGNFVLNWSAIRGETYVVESSPDLKAPWLPVREKTSEGSQASVSLPMTSPRHFYRVAFKDVE